MRETGDFIVLMNFYQARAGSMAQAHLSSYLTDKTLATIVPTAALLCQADALFVVSACL
jgi:hypothetical protein